MSVGILGTKLGMTQIFDDQGNSVPVTVVQAGPCAVTQVKTKQTDGYSAVQVGYGGVAEKALSKPELGHLSKAGVGPMRHLREYPIGEAEAFELGQQVTAEIFEAGQLVDVTGTSIGRGFAGYQKRHKFSPWTDGPRFQESPRPRFYGRRHHTRPYLPWEADGRAYGQ